jgi:hypothetical protein
LQHDTEDDAAAGSITSTVSEPGKAAKKVWLLQAAISYSIHVHRENNRLKTISDPCFDIGPSVIRSSRLILKIDPPLFGITYERTTFEGGWPDFRCI